MFCRRCGKEIADAERSCPYCGTPVAQVSSDAPAAMPKPASGGKKRRLLLIGIIAAVLILALAATLLLAGSPRARVAAALASTAREYSAVLEVWDLKQPHPLTQTDNVSMDLDIQLTDVTEELGSALVGLGVRMESDSDIPSRKIGLRLTPYYGSVEILQLQSAIVDDMLYFGIPELLPEALYGVNTVTMMADLQAMGLDVGEAASVSFNFFDIVEIVRQHTPDTRQTEQLLEEANAALVKSIQVERQGKKTLDINGRSVKCSCYLVTVPQAQLKAWLQTMEQLTMNSDSQEMTREVWESMGLPQDLVEEMVKTAAVDSPDEGFGLLYDYLELAGDLELNVGISKGKLAQVSYRDTADGSEVSAALSLGGAEHYADTLSLEVLVDGMGICLTSTGDHTARSGIFTDETEFTLLLDGDDSVKWTVTTDLDTRTNQDNLYVQCEESTGIFSFTVSGSRAISDDHIALEIDKCSLTVDGEKLLSCRVAYALTPFRNRIDVSGARLLSDMDANALAQTVEKIQSNLVSWAMQLMEDIPVLKNLL